MKRRESKRKGKWPPRRYKRQIKRHQRNLTYLHEEEERIILRDIAAINEGKSWLTALDLDRVFPGRYDMNMLPKVLKRMSVRHLKGGHFGPSRLESQRKTHTTFGSGSRGAMEYRLPQPKVERKAA